MNVSKLSAARSQQSRIASTRRYWPPWLAAIAIACSSATPLERATLAGPGDPIDASTDVDAPSDHDAGTSWCSIQAIWAVKCQRCHGTPATHGPPFALVSYDDTQVLDRKSHARFARIAKVVEEQSMQPAMNSKLEPAVEPLRDEERATLLSWCGQGATLTGSASCAAAP